MDLGAGQSTFRGHRRRIRSLGFESMFDVMRMFTMIPKTDAVIMFRIGSGGCRRMRPAPVIKHRTIE